MKRVRYLFVAGLLLLTGAGSCLFGQMVYVPNAGNETVSAFVVNPDAGNLTEVLPRVATLGTPIVVVVEPKGKFAYLVNSGDFINTPHVYPYSISPSTGALTRLSSLPVSAIGAIPSPVAATIDPSGKYLYVAAVNNTVSGFSLNAITGALTPVPGSPFATRNDPTGVAIEASGKYLYVSCHGANNVQAFSINSTNGALTQIAGSPFAAGTGPSWVATDGAGKFIFVANQGSNNVSAYTIDSATGALTAAPGSPFKAGTGPNSAAVDPLGHFLYVSNGFGDNISGYSIDSATGALTAMPVSPFSSPRTPYAMAMDPAGKFLYVTNLLANNVSSYAIGPQSGALAPVSNSPFATGSSPQHPGVIQLSPPITPPVIAQSALNAASYAGSWMPNYGIARGSMFIVFGQNLGPAALQQATSYPLPNQIGGTSIQVSVGGTTVQAIMIYSYVTQVAAIMPSAVPAGDGTLTVTYNNNTSATLPIHVVNGSVGIFTRNQAGSGPAIVQNYNSATDQPVNSVIESAHPGQTMIMWATGLGAVTFNETQPPTQFNNVRTDAEVWVGNKRANVSYSGRSQYPGIDQINFTLPADVAVGCYVPLAVRLGSPSVVSNFGSIAITAQGKVCSDPHGLSAKDWAPLTTGGSLNVGWVQLARENISASDPSIGGAVTALVDGGWGDFYHLDAVTGLSDSGLDMVTGRITSLGGCTVISFGPNFSSYAPSRAAFLDAGPNIAVTVGNRSGQLMRSKSGTYDDVKAFGASAPASIVGEGTLPAPMFDSGTISVDNGSGGSAIGKFKASWTVPASPVALNFTNLSDIATAGIDRSKDLTVTWTGGDPASEYIIVAGGVILPDIVAKQKQGGAGFLCAEKAGAGSLTIPSVVLSALPASTPGDAMSGFLGAGRAPLLTDSLKFTASGLDIGYLTMVVMNATLVAIR